MMFSVFCVDNSERKQQYGLKRPNASEVSCPAEIFLTTLCWRYFNTDTGAIKGP